MAPIEESANENMIDVGGYRLCLSCAGQGTPAVVPMIMQVWARKQ